MQREVARLSDLRRSPFVTQDKPSWGSSKLRLVTRTRPPESVVRTFSKLLHSD